MDIASTRKVHIHLDEREAVQLYTLVRAARGWSGPISPEDKLFADGLQRALGTELRLDEFCE